MATPTDTTTAPLKDDTEFHGLLQQIADAAYGDSNDTEIELLREALDATLAALNIEMPEGRDPWL